jgi:hypothetical protein
LFTKASSSDETSVRICRTVWGDTAEESTCMRISDLNTDLVTTRATEVCWHPVEPRCRVCVGVVLYIVRLQVQCLPSGTPLHTAFIKYTHNLTVRPTEHPRLAPALNSNRVTPNEQCFAWPPCFCPLNIRRLSQVARTGVSMIQLHTQTHTNIR